MSDRIELHCTGCNALIKAPKSAGGKHGKCPHCDRRLYIPMPEDEIETYEIADMTEEERAAEERMREEERRLREEVARQKEIPGETGGGKRATGAGAAAPPPPKEKVGEVVDVRTLVETYLISMKESKLDDAEEVVAQLRSAKQRAKDYVEGLILDEVPPSVEGVPPQIVTGLLKSLSARLN